ncbi:protein NDR1-like [Henckelia pumila]|uniref:protein NDR1-like n=1 Tax=Henckelia pumila TaxID=405737 RepID=UPI003C6DE139
MFSQSLFSLKKERVPRGIIIKHLSGMAERDPGGCGRCCCSFIFTSGLTALFMWLSLRTSYPTCSIEQFYVPALNVTANSADNRTVFFHLLLANRMKDKGVRYRNISLTFLYGGKSSTSVVANYTVKGFYQGHKKKANREELVQATGVPWEEAAKAVSGGSTVNFGVRLVTRVKFKIVFWYTKWHNLEVVGDLAVGGGGQKVGKKGIKLTSGAPDRGWRWARTSALRVSGRTFFFLITRN